MKTLKKNLGIIVILCIVMQSVFVYASAVATPLTAGNSKETAANIPQYGVEYVSTLSFANEKDWFKFTTLNDDAYYNISLINYSCPTGGNGTWALNWNLFDTNMQNLSTGSNDNNREVVFNLKLEKNTTYYLQAFMGRNATDGIGNYRILITYKYDEVANDKKYASELSLNKVNISSMDGTGDVDWFKFTTNPVDTKYTITGINYDCASGWNAGFSVNYTIYDENMQTLGSGANSYNDTVKLDLELEKNTTYYIKVMMGVNVSDSIGNYEITITPVGEHISPTKNLSSIYVSSSVKKTEYKIGEKLDTSGLIIKGKYSDGSEKAISGYTLTGFDSSSAGIKTINVSYTENGITKDCSFKINVKESEGEIPDTPSFDFSKFLSKLNNILDKIITMLPSIINFISRIINIFIK